MSIRARVSAESMTAGAAQSICTVFAVREVGGTNLEVFLSLTLKFSQWLHFLIYDVSALGEIQRWLCGILVRMQSRLASCPPPPNRMNRRAGPGAYGRLIS